MDWSFKVFKPMEVMVLTQAKAMKIMQETEYGKGPFFLVVTADEWNHDDDRWLGIYVSKKDAREAYDRAVAWWAEEQRQMSLSTSQRVAMFEYVAFDDRFREVDRKELD